MYRSKQIDMNVSHNMLIPHHNIGFEMTGRTMPYSIQSGTTMLRVPPLRRSNISKAKEPARMTCMTLRAADDRSFAADASTKYLVLDSTFLNTSSRSFVLMTLDIRWRVMSCFVIINYKEVEEKEKEEEKKRKKKNDNSQHKRTDTHTQLLTHTHAQE